MTLEPLTVSPEAIDLARVNAALKNTKPQPGFTWCAPCGANKPRHLCDFEAEAKTGGGEP